MDDLLREWLRAIVRAVLMIAFGALALGIVVRVVLEPLAQTLLASPGALLLLALLWHGYRRLRR